MIFLIILTDLTLVVCVCVCVPSSLCTMLSLQWEPEIIAVAVMYLAGRLCKFDIQEWTAKQSSRRWWEQFVQDVPVELLEGAPLLPSAFLPHLSDASHPSVTIPPSCRHLPPDPGSVLPGKQAHPSADPGERAGASYPHLSSPSPTGAAPDLQPAASTAQEGLSSGWQPGTPTQTLACKQANREEKT